MRWMIPVVLLATAQTAGAAETIATSQIEAVTVFPSGAEIVRVAKVKLDGGEHVVVFSDLAAMALASSIRVEGKATGKLAIGSVDSRRLFVPRSDAVNAETERKRIEDELEAARDERAGLEGQVQAAETQKALLANLAQLPARPDPPAPQAGAPPQQDWTQILGVIGTGTEQAYRALIAAQIKIRETDRKIEELARKLAELPPAREERTEVKVFVTAEAPLEADLVVRYQVPNASWSPFYDARLTTGTKTAAPRLHLTRRASVSQRTGESWDNVILALSTARPTAGTALPELFPMAVDYEQPKPPPPPPSPVAAAPRSRQLRDGEGAVSMGEDRAADTEMAEAPVAEKQAEAAVAPFQAVYNVPGKLSIPSTGEEKRVQLTEDQIEPALTVRSVPKQDAKAYLYAKLKIPGGAPLLAGTVSLFRDGTYAGNGELPVLASGEEWEMGFGVDDLVRVRHALIEEKRGETGIISSSSTDERNFRVTVKNMHERAVEFTFFDQIPVSQNESIKVELLGRVAPAKRDVDNRRGVLAWTFKLEPDEERVVDYGYRVSWPADKRITYGN